MHLAFSNVTRGPDRISITGPENNFAEAAEASYPSPVLDPVTRAWGVVKSCR